MDDLIFFAMLLMSALINLCSVEDALIDVIAFGISRFSLARGPSRQGEIPSVGVFVANWREEDILDKMVEGNLARIPMPSVRLYLGVYPNDTGTRDVAMALAKRHPDRVRVIVNTLAGPTSKGQMLNEMFRQVYSSDERPEMVVLHDSEDIIDPRTFEIYARYAEQHDFIQVPVFSLNSTERSMVAATYMDEFAERHTREMIVRNALGATIPSAGVGTCLTRRLIEHFVRIRGNVLMNGCVTEDYILGVEAKRAGFKAAFAAVSAQERQGLDYVATREFFPKSLAASIKQKTRWVYGINFEATRKLGWAGDAWDRYFFVRDRKGAVTNFLPAVSLVFLLLILLEQRIRPQHHRNCRTCWLFRLAPTWCSSSFAISCGYERVTRCTASGTRLGSRCDGPSGSTSIWQPSGAPGRFTSGNPPSLHVDRVGEDRPRNPRRSCECQKMKGQIMRYS